MQLCPDELASKQMLDPPSKEKLCPMDVDKPVSSLSELVPGDLHGFELRRNLLMESACQTLLQGFGSRSRQ